MKKLLNTYLYGQQKLRSFAQDEKGGAEIVAIVLILVVVVALAIIFRKAITEFVSDIIAKITDDAQSGGFTNP